ncbi:ABC transporter substrate-binding protein [Methyloradius palustris]|uniref:Peptide-binding protein n=1 Tax=Methyloradius palustris TaxID=2778876 RepID=A0A8D5G2T3_9PROT|nr:ABC transporter substrate-binding protein [Methyloradius palustris]BCM24630.1 peptide-binding protein [Methyloradius palustris]
MKQLALVIILISACFSACSKPTEPNKNAQQAIRIGLAQAPLNLDPRFATDAASARINRLLYRSLVDFDEHSLPVPSLANWQQISPFIYRFKLQQQGRIFHHDAALTADDVAATYQSFTQLKGSPLSNEFANIQQVKVVDVDTVDFYLKTADPQFPSRLIIGILPADLIKSGHDFAHQPIGSGPLKLVSWNSQLVLERVVDQQIFSFSEVKDQTVRVLKLMRGEVDMLQSDLPPELVKYLSQQPEITVQSAQGANFSYIGLNMQDALLSKPEVRLAIAHAIDTPAIIMQVLVADSRQAGAILPPEHWAGNAALTPYDYNPKLARELLIKSGIQLPLKLVYKTSTDAQRVRLATIMQAQMQAAGIDLEIRSLDWGTFFDDIQHGKFQLYGLTWVGIKTPEVYRLAFHRQSIPPKGANRGQFKDAKLDQLIGAENWPAVTQYVHEQLPYIPLWYEGQFVAMHKGLVDYGLKADGSLDGLATIHRN